MSVSLDKHGGKESESSSDPRTCSQLNVATAGNSSANRATVPWREALELWLRWNSMYERVTELAYDGRENQQHLEDLMDQMDQIRRRAVNLSADLIK